MSFDSNLWSCACFRESATQETIWYCSTTRAVSNYADYLAALEDAKRGNKRAQQYIARYTELRMTL